MNPNLRSDLREGLLKSYKHRLIDGAACAVCGAEGGLLAGRVIEFAQPEHLPRPDGFVETSASGGTVRGVFPVCIVCAPPCGRCELPVRTSRVRKKFSEMHQRLDSSHSPLAWGNGSCEHLWHWSRWELVGIVREPRVSSEAPAQQQDQHGGVRPHVAARSAGAKATDATELHQLEMQPPSSAFRECWVAAGRHLEARGQDATAWIKAELSPPFLEHLSFRLGNQLFFVRIEDEAGRVHGPGSARGIERIASKCDGHACVMPMTQEGRGWKPVHPGWGLLDLHSRRPIDPPSLITDDDTEITDWELHDFAVQTVRRHLKDEELTVVSWAGDPEVDPSLWIERDGKMEWVLVRAVRYPARRAAVPKQIATIARNCAAIASRGHFASVAVANAADLEAPLWRGHGYHVAFGGLEEIGTGRGRPTGSEEHE